MFEVFLVPETMHIYYYYYYYYYYIRNKNTIQRKKERKSASRQDVLNERERLRQKIRKRSN
jgi:hypothetical protein